MNNLFIKAPLLYFITLFIFMMSVQSLYSITPSNSFKAMDPTSLFALPVIKLSPSGDKLAISYLNMTALSLIYKTVTLEGMQQCRDQHTTDTRYLIAWPRDNGLMFLANDNVTVNYFTEQCDDLRRLVTFERKPYKLTTTYRKNDEYGSIVTFAHKNTQNINFISEYQIKNKSELKHYQGWKDDITRSISYSEDGDILFIGGTFSNKTVNYTWQQVRVTSSTMNLEINTTLIPKKVINNEYECIGLINDTYVKMDSHNNTQTIHRLEQSEVEGGICTKDNLLILLRYTNVVEKIEMLVYSTKDGSLQQTILLDFIPVPMGQPLGGTRIIECGDNSLVLLGGDGIVRVYTYSTPPILPVYAIVLICIAGAIILLVIGICVCKVCKRRRKKLHQGQRFKDLNQYSKLNKISLNQ